MTRTLKITLSSKQEYKSLLPTLFIGEHPHGLYALPGLVEKSTVPIIKFVDSQKRPLLISDGTLSKTDSSDTEDRDDARVYGPAEIEIVRQSTTPVDADGDIGDDVVSTTTTTPATPFVLVLGHHEVPERQRSKFLPHHGGADDPHLAQRERDLERIQRNSDSAIYPAIKDVNDTPLRVGEAPGQNDALPEPANVLPAKR